MLGNRLFKPGGFAIRQRIIALACFWGIALCGAHAQQADFFANATEGCSPLTVQFVNQSTGPITTYAWDFGNGNTSNLPNPGVIYVNPGTYTVRLIVSDGTISDTLVRTDYITVFADPAPAFTLTPTGGCVPLAVTVADQSTPGDAPINDWVWDFGDGNVANGPNPAHTYTSPGMYDVTLIVTDTNGCSASLLEPDLVTVSAPSQVAPSFTLPNTCQLPFAVSFAANPAAAGYTYAWDFGDGNTSTQENPVHAYTAPGNYIVSLITTSAGGCADTTTLPDAIPLLFPVANFAVADTSVCVDEALNLFNFSSGATSYLWNFGDGTVVSGPTPVHAYQASGSYTIILIASNALGCRDTMIRTAYVEVNDAPTSGFTSSDPVSCGVPFVVDFMDASLNALAWEWDFGDGNVANVANPSHVYQTPGYYDVQLITTSASGCRDTILQPAYVQIVPPIADFIADTIRGCVPMTVDFQDLSVSPFDSITTWIWNFGDGGTAFGPNPTYTYATVGQFTAQLIVQTSQGCRDTVEQIIEAGTPPTIAFDANPRVVCATDPVAFLNQTNFGTEWEWFFGDGGTSADQNPIYSYGDTGLFTVTLIATYFGCSDTLEIPDFIRVLPPIAEFFTNPTEGCEVPLTVAFNDVSTGADTWFWTFGDGAVDSVQFPIHTYTAPGVYTITLTVTNDSTGCVDDFSYDLPITNPVAAFNALNVAGCTGTDVSFINGSLDAVTFEWDFGDGNVSTDANPVHSYDSPGTYDVRLIATNVNGCSDTLIQTQLVQIVGPEANFVVDTTTGCAPLTVTFTDSSFTVPGNVALVGWQWDFGDGTTAIGPNQSHQFINPGQYDITLVVVDDQGCSDTLVRPQYIQPTFPAAAFTTLDTLSCPGAPVQFVNQSTGVGNTYQWDFGDGTTSTVPNPVKVYPGNAGQFTVTLIATDINGCQSVTTLTDYIEIGPPVSLFAAAPTQQSCPPLTVSFTNQSSANVTDWQWDFGDGSTSSIPNPSKVYNIPGNYDVRLVVATSQGCRDTLTLPGLIDLTGPQGSFSMTPLAGCNPLEVSFTAQTQGAVSWTWDFGDGNLGFGQTTTHTYIQDTLATPVLVIEDTAGCTVAIPANDSILVRPRPIPQFTVSQQQTCEGEALTFTNQTSSQIPVISYQWDFGDGNTSTATNPQHSYAAPGTYTIQLTAINLNGCIDSISSAVPISVNSRPNADFTPSQTSGCAPLTLTFNGNSGGASPIAARFWDFGDGNTATTQSPLHTFTTPGTYTVRLVVVDANGCEDSLEQDITVFPSPTADFLVSGTDGCAPRVIQFADQSQGNVSSWFWDFGDGNTSNLPNPQHQYVVDGDFDVSLTIMDGNGCVDTLLQPDLISLERPTAAFVSNSFVSCPPALVDFTATASSDTNIVNWYWDFGNGDTAVGPAPSYTFTQGGNFDIQLIVVDALGCTDTLVDTQAVNLLLPPTAEFILSDSVFCAPGMVTANSLSIPGGSALNTSIFDLGNGNTASGTSVNAQYGTGGTYALSLVITDLNGCSDTASQTILVHPEVQADFSASDTADCVQTTLAFSDLSQTSNSIVSWDWDFGDGNGSNISNPTHAYDSAGLYTVQLAVSDQNGCVDTLSRPAYIDIDGPQANFTPLNSLACPGTSLSFSDASSSAVGIVAWLWDFGDGTTANGPNPTHVYAQPGFYTITLRVTDANGCTHQRVALDAVEINDFPQASFLSSQTAGCAPLTIDFTDQSISANSTLIDWDWAFGNGNTYNFPNATQTFSQAGSYTIFLTVTDANGCTAVDSQLVTVDPQPQASFVADLQFGCAPRPITFLSQSGGVNPVVNWTWDFGDGNTGNGALATHTYTTDGSYDVQLVVEDANGCTDSLTLPQFVEIGEPEVSFIVDDSLACPGTLLSFADASQPDTPFVAWNWNFGDGTTGTGSTAQHVYANAGTYDVTLTITDALGCTGSQTIPAFVDILTPPVADMVLSDTAACPPFNLQYVDQSQGNAAITGWNWDLGNGNTSNFPNGFSTYTNPGLYTIELVATDANGCQDTTSREIEVFGPPQVGLLASRTLGCVGEQIDFQDISIGAAPVVYWEWDFGDGNTSLDPQPNHTYTQTGTYDVSLTIVDARGCTDSLTLPQYIEITQPQADFGLTGAPACPTGVVSFLDQSNADTLIIGWQWDFGDGNTGVGPQPQHTYNSPGLYDVQLIINDALGCTDTLIRPQAVEIFTPPVAAFTLMPEAGCAPLITVANDSSYGLAPISSWQWRLDGGVPANGPSAQYLLDSAGTYTLNLQVTDQNGCRDTVERDIEVFDLPEIDFFASDTVGCAPNAIVFTSTSIPDAVAWEWDFGDGNTASVQNPIHTYDSDSTYTVSLTVTDGNGCSTTLTKPQYIELARPEATFTARYVQGCPPVDVTFEAAATSPYGITDYLWDFGEGSQGQGNPAVHTYLDTGLYTIRLTVIDGLGCEQIIEEDAVYIFGEAKPEPVRLHRVSVVSAEATRLVWEPSLATDFSAYVVYWQNPANSLWEPIFESQGQTDTVFQDLRPGLLDCEKESYCYRILQRNECGTLSALAETQEHCTVELQATALPDRIVLNWNNYVGWAEVDRYEIYRVDNYQPETLEFLDVVGGEVLSYVDQSTRCFNQYSYRVQAFGMGVTQFSLSDTASAINRKTAPTESAYVVTATVEENRAVRVDWEPFPVEDLIEIFLERSDDGGLNWNTLATLPATELTYLDEDVEVQTLSYAYRLRARDSCGFTTPYGNLGKSIVLSADAASFSRSLEWTAYEAWPDGVDYYEIQVFNEGSGQWEQVDVVPGTQLSYDDGRTFLDQGQYCYRIIAHELGGRQATSVSNETCTGIDPRLHVPNVFSPNGDGVNETFQIKGVYIQQANVKIFSRWGRQVFEASSLEDAWDGTHGGQAVPEGVYVIAVEAIANNGQPIKHRGTITVIR